MPPEPAMQGATKHDKLHSKLAGCTIVAQAKQRGAWQEVARGQALSAHAATDLAELAGVYGALARGFREEYVMYNLPAAALAQARRLLRASLCLCLRLG